MTFTEQQISEALEGKFFWVTSSYGERSAEANSRAIILAQREFRKVKKVKAPPLEKVVIEKPRKVVGYGAKIAAIRDAVAKVHGVAPERLVQRGRTQDIIMAKHHFTWSIIRYLPRLSVSEASRRIGRNHTTLLHSRDLFERIKGKYRAEIAVLDAALMGIEEA